MSIDKNVYFLYNINSFLTPFAGVAQPVEHYLAKVGVAGSNPVSRFEMLILKIKI